MLVGLRRRQGFTLIETLAAFTILALSLMQLMSSIRVGAENERRADFMMRASLAMKSQMARLGADLPLDVGDTTGHTDDGLIWVLSVRHDHAITQKGGSPLLIGYRVNLDILPPYKADYSMAVTSEKLVSYAPKRSTSP